MQIIRDGPKLQIYIYFLKEFQPMTSAPDDNSFIITPKHQSVFYVGREVPNIYTCA